MYKKSYYNDIALALAKRIFDVEHLHFGYFDQDTHPTIENLPQAQENYASHLLDYIPDGVHCIFDVGCGVGGVADSLLKKGFEVTCMAPDPFLIEETKKRTRNQVTTITLKYEDLSDAFCKEKEASFDLILMSESCQYIDVKKGWALNKHFLGHNGYVLVADFFQIKEIDRDFISKSGHKLDSYLHCAQQNGFKLITQKDITANVIGTMKLYSNIIDQYGFPIVEALGRVLERRFPFFYKILLFIFRKKLYKLKQKYSHQDAETFQKYKAYFVLLFQKS